MSFPPRVLSLFAENVISCDFNVESRGTERELDHSPKVIITHIPQRVSFISTMKQPIIIARQFTFGAARIDAAEAVSTSLASSRVVIINHYAFRGLSPRAAVAYVTQPYQQQHAFALSNSERSSPLWIHLIYLIAARGAVVYSILSISLLSCTRAISCSFSAGPS